MSALHSRRRVYRLWCLRTGLPGQISPEDEVPPQWKADIDMNADYDKLSHEAFDALADQLRAGASREEARCDQNMQSARSHRAAAQERPLRTAIRVSTLGIAAPPRVRCP